MPEETHYVCVECGGVSSERGVCETEDCSMEGEELEECTCEDGDHAEVMDGFGLDDDYDDDDYYDDDDEDY